MSAQITQHAFERGRQRLGFNRAAMERTAEIALRDGFKHSEMSGALKRYCDRLFLSHGTANNIRIHGEQVFVFTGDKLITVHHVPGELKRHLKKLRTQRHAAEARAS